LTIEELLEERNQLALTIKESSDARKEIDKRIINKMQDDITFQREAVHEYFTDRFVVKAKTSMSRTIDEEELVKMQLEFPDLELPIKRHHTVDMSKIHAFARDNPKLYHRFCYVITSKPRATALTIKENKVD
jgi:hypothetical protein